VQGAKRKFSISGVQQVKGRSVRRFRRAFIGDTSSTNSHDGVTDNATVNIHVHSETIVASWIARAQNSRFPAASKCGITAAKADSLRWDDSVVIQL